MKAYAEFKAGARPQDAEQCTAEQAQGVAVRRSPRDKTPRSYGEAVNSNAVAGNLFGKRKRVESELTEYERFKLEDGMDKADGSFGDEIPKVDIKEWWTRHKHQFPTLYPVAMALLGSQPTSAQPERDFSSAGLVLSAKSSTMDSRAVEVRLFNKFNKRFLPNLNRPAPQRR